MEGNEFEIDDFERTLREAADRFYMKPSERVWRSIYNDLHPGSKWPSLAVALFMLLTLFWIGNNNRTNPGMGITTAESTTTQNKGDNVSSTDIENEDINALNSEEGQTTAQADTHKLAIVRSIDSYQRTNDNHKTINHITIAQEKSGPAKTVRMKGIPTADEPILSAKISAPTSVGNQVSNMIPGTNTSASEQNTANNDDIASNNYYQNKNAQQKSKAVTWKYYFSPMITSVSFGGVNLNNSRSTLAYTPVSGHQMNIADRLGFVVGGNAYFRLNDKMEIFSGLHLGHMGYNIYGRLSRPDLASLTLIDKKGVMYNRVYVSHFSNGEEGRKADITNFNWQVSVPVGVKYDVYSASKFKISLMTGVEPLMVMGSKAYLLSGDAGSYVQDPSLIRKVNMNANFGVVTTFEGKHSSWEIGTNFRYQMLSTYDNTYPVKEHFINYGIHIAVGKKK